jgi:hypothetical protein
MKGRSNNLHFARVLSILVIAGCKGSAGDAGPAGPTMPVIQSMAVSGVPAARTGTVTIKVSAQSAEGLSLTYAWAVTTGWNISSGGAMDTVTIKRLRHGHGHRYSEQARSRHSRTEHP